MSQLDTNYKQYMSETLMLTKSLLVKNSFTAIGMNKFIEQLGYSVSDDQKTWRYYMNVSGQYHYLDKEMYVTSFDTKETILLSVENIKLHPLTREALLPHTENFKRLVSEYPSQELLIRGIMNPCELEKAVEVEDYSILSYDERYIEEQETTLIYDLEQKIKDFGSRWNNPSYTFIDELYLTSHLAILYMSIPHWLLALRLERTHTNQVHSFHIKEHLKSNGRLDRFFDFLTLKQKLFLYRNIRYINRNVGKQDVFKWLVEKLLTDRNINISEINALMNLENFKDSKNKTLDFYRSNLNNVPEMLSDKTFDFRETLVKERDLGTENYRVEDETILEKKDFIENSTKEKYRTKILESVLRDLGDGGPYILSKELITHWGFMALLGDYKSTFRFVIPSTGQDIRLNTKEAFIVFIYLMNLKGGTVLTRYPTLRFSDIYGYRNPSRLELEAIVPSDRNYSEEINMILTDRTVKTITTQPYSFFNLISRYFKKILFYRRVYSQKDDMYDRGFLESIAFRKFTTETIDTQGLVSDESLPNWIDSIGLGGDFNSEDIDVLVENILRECTGIDYYDDYSLSGIQKAMLELMGELSSYHVHYTRDTNSLPIPYWDRISVRPGEVNAKEFSNLRLDYFDKIVRETFGRNRDGLFIDMDKPNLMIDEKSLTRSKVTLDTSFDPMVKNKRTDRIRLLVPGVYTKDVR